MSIVFFSNGILPGPDATQLDAATWEEVLGLSLNFWLVAPLLQLPFSPALHPGLEGIFNLLLAWAAAFAGFLSDGRPGALRTLSCSRSLASPLHSTVSKRALCSHLTLVPLLELQDAHRARWSRSQQACIWTAQRTSRCGESAACGSPVRQRSNHSLMHAPQFCEPPS